MQSIMMEAAAIDLLWTNCRVLGDVKSFRTSLWNREIRRDFGKWQTLVLECQTQEGAL